MILELEGDLKAGEAVFANMSISKDGQPVDFLELVMGAFAHMVGFYEDYQSIRPHSSYGRRADRRHGTLALSPVFKTGAFDHSADFTVLL